MSSSLSQTEIAERIEKDDGALDETVLLKRSTAGTRHIYHKADDPCYDVEDTAYRAGPERVTREKARERGLAPCERCIIGVDTSRDHDMTAQMVARRFDPERHDSLSEARAELEASD